MANEPVTPLPSTPANDREFQDVLSISCGIAIMGIIAAVASLKITPTERFHFDWDWTTPIWMLMGAVFNWRFWRNIWEMTDRPTPRGKVKIGFYVAALIAAGIFGFLYPLRFLAANKMAEIALGLVSAALFLGTLGAIMFFLARGLNRADATELERMKQG